VTDIATLGIKVDSTQAAKGAADLDRLAVSADKVQTATDAATVSIGRQSAVTNAQASAARQATTAIINSATATQHLVWTATAQASTVMRSATATAQASFGMNAFAAATGGATKQVAAESQAIEQAIRLMERMISTMERANRVPRPRSPGVPGGVSPGANNMNVANLAAQFQDIGVTAAMGQNPLQVALQQGTQISAVLGPMGAAGAVKSLGAAFLSVISPVAFATIAIVGLVSAGLQFVNWAAVAKGALNGVANVLKPIAPYAVAVAAALALLYAPTIVGGIVSMIAWLGRLAVSALSAAVAMAAANPGVAFVLGITAAVAAAVIFRNELKQIFGFDIVNDVKQGTNLVIAMFVGGFNAIKLTWRQLPSVLGDAAITTANNVIGAVQGMINGAIFLLNSMIERTNSITGKVGIKFGQIGNVDFGKIANPFSGAMGGEIDAIAAEIQKVQKTDFIGQFVTGVGKAASKAADMLHGLADSIKGTDKEAEKAAKAAAKRYAGIVRDANQFIASQTVEQSTIGLTTEAANRLRYEQDLLNKAQDAGVKVTGAQRSELSWLARGMAAAEAVTTKLRAAYDFTRDTIKGFASDLRTSLANGEGWWQSFANAGLNALQKITDKLLDMALDQAINSLFRNILGPLLGGMFGGGSSVLSGGLALGMGGIGHNAVGNVFSAGNVIPFANGTVVNRPTLFPMANGGTGLMGEAGEEAIMPLRRTAGGRLGVEMAGGSSGGGAVDVRVSVSVDKNGELQAFVENVSGKVVDRYDRFQAPRTIARHKNKTMIETGGKS
jgi:lambda family phage tail tape measure protein